MSLLVTLQEQYNKLTNTTIVREIWKEIISGRKSLISSDQVIEYSFHYPVDTKLYLEELVKKFDETLKEDLRTIDGSLKAYFQTFLYYCLGSSDRVSLQSSLFAAELYLKLILLPSDIGKLYYEKNMYAMVLFLLNKCTKQQNIPTEQIIAVMELTLKYVCEQNASFIMIQGTANLYANVVKYRASEGNVKQSDDPLMLFCQKSLKDLLIIKEHPKEVKYVMDSMLRCLRSDISKSISQEQRKLTTNLSKGFIRKVLVEVEDQNKLQYFLDSLFSLFGKPDFDYFEDCVDIINMLNEQLYKELLHRIPNYLESKNHEHYYANLMVITYYMLKKPHPEGFSKLDVLYSICLKNIIIHMLNKKKQIQYKTIEVLANICLLENNNMLNRIFELINETGSLACIETTGILKAMIKILNDQHAGHAVRSKNILYILSKMLCALNKLDGDLASHVLYLICKGGTPFSIKNILPNLHNLYLQLAEKTTCTARLAIMRIFFKMAMHSDASSSVFVEHLYRSVIFPSTIQGREYGPEQYSNILFSDEFDYSLFLAKCRLLIKYEHVHHIISHFNFKEPGYYILLNSMLDFVKYKEHIVLTDYILENFEELSCVDTFCHLLNSYKRIVLNKGVYQQSDLPKFDMICSNLWDLLYEETSSIMSIKPSFALIDVFKDILNLADDEEQRVRLLNNVSESAFRALKQNQMFMGSIMLLTELCIVLRRPPRNEILTILENVLDDPRTMTLITTRHKDTLIQLISFFGTIAMMNRPKIPIAVKLFKRALEVIDPIVQLTALKMYYNLCTEITHEFDEIIRFCFNHVTSDHTVLSRVCITILEELIYDTYILLNSEDFMRFVHRLASRSLGEFMIHVLDERFVVSNKHDVGRFYMNTLVYMSGHTKFDNYPVSQNFKKDLTMMRSLIDYPNELIRYLFTSIQIKIRFSILKEMCAILDSLVAGKCKVDENFFVYLHYSLYTFKVMSCKPSLNYKGVYYSQVCRSIEKQIVNRDPKYKPVAFYGEYETEVKMCTKSLLNLLFFIQEEERLSEHLLPIFDTVACWVDHVKAELVHYVQYEKGKEFDHLFKKLVQFHKSNKDRLENYLNNSEG
ncbi:uncharacterized protein [Euwallacea fornicatus]|uniref:uncharacterized protein isoform X1 n=2 Tax=Euwallacea fornicatus TaxID=995702 RepID=UPI00338E98ED